MAGIKYMKINALRNASRTILTMYIKCYYYSLNWNMFLIDERTVLPGSTSRFLYSSEITISVLFTFLSSLSSRSPSERNGDTCGGCRPTVHIQDVSPYLFLPAIFFYQTSVFTITFFKRKSIEFILMLLKL